MWIFLDQGLNPCLLHWRVYMLVTQLQPTLCHPWSLAPQASLSLEFSRQEYWSELPFPSPGLAGRFFTTEPPGKPLPQTFFFCFLFLRREIPISRSSINESKCITCEFPIYMCSFLITQIQINQFYTALNVTKALDSFFLN